LTEWGLAQEVGKRWIEVPVGFPFETELDLREVVPAAVKFSKPALYDFQRRAVDELLKSEHGYLVSPTGSGKTIMALAIAAELQQRTLFVCHTKQIAEQTCEKVEKFLGVKPARWWGRHAQFGDFTVALVQKITRSARPLPKHGLLIVDETHHLGCPMFFSVLRRSGARYKYGLTATFEHRLYPREAFIFALSGHVVEVPVEACFQQKVLAETVVIGVKTGLGSTIEREFCDKFCPLEHRPDKCRECPLKETRLYSFVEGWIDNYERNTLVLEVVDIVPASSVLILTRRIEHAENITKLLLLEGKQALVAHGRMRKQSRSEMIEKFKSEGGILVATESLLGEGADFPECDCLILTCPARGGIRGKQRAGRVMRYGKGKTSLIIDLIDDNDLCRKLWWSRRRAYEKLGIKVIESNLQTLGRKCREALG